MRIENVVNKLSIYVTFSWYVFVAIVIIVNMIKRYYKHKTKLSVVKDKLSKN